MLCSMALCLFGGLVCAVDAASGGGVDEVGWLSGWIDRGTPG